MKMAPGDFVHFRRQISEDTWSVHFGRIIHVEAAMIQVNTGEEDLWVEVKHVVHEGERFQDRLI